MCKPSFKNSFRRTYISIAKWLPWLARQTSAATRNGWDSYKKKNSNGINVLIEKKNWNLKKI